MLDGKKKAAIGHAVLEARAITWDGCHKIYILLDENQVARMRKNGYDTRPDRFVPVDHHDAASRAAARKTLIQWYEGSCSLRFIEAVRTTDTDPNDGYVNVIAQFE